jgi:hypothetical protein
MYVGNERRAAKRKKKRLNFQKKYRKGKESEIKKFTIQS